MPNRFEGPLSFIIRYRRILLGKTQQQIADTLGVTADFVALLESGRRRLDLDKVPLLAGALRNNRRALCQQALLERAPLLYHELFEVPKSQGA